MLAFLLLGAISTACQQGQSNHPVGATSDQQNWLGLTSATRLYCRSQPAPQATIKTSLPFASPVHLSARSSAKSQVGKHSDYWYKEDRLNCWLFGAYLKLTATQDARILVLEPERIACNFVCGGNSCMPAMHPYIVGDYYATRFDLYDYCDDTMTEIEYCSGMAIGRVHTSDTQFDFKPALQFAYLHTKRKSLDFKGPDSTGRQLLLNYEPGRYKKQKDSRGIYFAKPNTITRAAAIAQCQAIKQKGPDGQIESLYRVYHLLRSYSAHEFYNSSETKYIRPGT